MNDCVATMTQLFVLKKLISPPPNSTHPEYPKIPGVRGGLCNPSYWDGGIWGWLVDREPPKGSKWPAEGPHNTWGSSRGGVHTQVPPGADWIPICLAAAVLGLTWPREVGMFVLFSDVRRNP